MKKSKEHNILLMQILSCGLVSIFSGILIGFFQVAIKCLFDGIEGIYESSIQSPTPIILYSLFSVIGIVAVYILFHCLGIGLSKGGILVNRYLENEDVKWYEYPLLLLGFFVSLFAGLPVGAVEVSQTIGITLTSRIYSRSDLEDPDALDISSSASFGAIFMSPLAGLAHIAETRKWKITIPFLAKAIVSVGIAVLCAFLVRLIFGIHTESLLRIVEFETFSWKSLFTYAFLGGIIAIAALVLNLATRKIRILLEEKDLSEKVSNILTPILILIAVVCTFIGLKEQWYTFALAGYDGGRILAYFDKFRIGLLIGVLFLWAFYILAMPHAKLIGGKTVPVITFGALLGVAFTWHGKDIGFMNADESYMMISVAMFAFYGVVYKRPVTAVCLALTFSKWSVIYYEFIPLVFAVVPGYLLMKIAKAPTLNEVIGVSESIGTEE